MPDQQTSDQSRELKACPFCGATGDGSLNGNLHFVCDAGQRNHRVKCFNCGAEGGRDNSVDEAIYEWNTRPTPDLSNVEELVERVSGILALNTADEIFSGAFADIEAKDIRALLDTITALLDRRS